MVLRLVRDDEPVPPRTNQEYVEDMTGHITSERRRLVFNAMWHDFVTEGTYLVAQGRTEEAVQLIHDTEERFRRLGFDATQKTKED